MGARLREVQSQIRAALDRAPSGPFRVVSACAGDGRDLLGALVDHPRRDDVRALLIELSPTLVAAGRARVRSMGVTGVEFAQGDAGESNAYLGSVPANLVLLCGVFGNITDEDLRNTVDHAPELCAPGATVIWTRGRFAPDLTPTIRRWFHDAGFEELSFSTIVGSTKSVGVHRLVRPPPPFRPGTRLFTFLPEEERPSHRSGSRVSRASKRPLSRARRARRARSAKTPARP